MTWFKVDDRLHAHPKALATSLAALGLWTVAGSWSSAHRTGGDVPDHVIPQLCRGASELADELVAAGLWRRARGGYRFHDWADFNPTREEAIAQSSQKSIAGALGNHRRWHVERGVTAPDCQFCQQVLPSHNDRRTDRTSDPPANRPDPTRPVGVTRGDARTHDPPDERAPPPQRCATHQDHTGRVPPCRDCADARRAHDAWQASHPNGNAPGPAGPAQPPPVETVLEATRGPDPDPELNVARARQLRASLRRPPLEETE